MTAKIPYPHVTKPQGQPAHLERFPRLRIAQIVMDHLAYGWSVEEMARHHPYLTLSELYAAMGYYFDHQEEIDQEINLEWEQVQQEKKQVSPSPFFLRMKSKG